MTAIRGCRGAERAKDADGYLYTKRRLINAKYGIKIEWECPKKKTESDVSRQINNKSRFNDSENNCPLPDVHQIL